MGEVAGFFGTIISCLLSGGVTGLFGVAFQRYFDLKKIALDNEAAKDKQAHEQALRALDLNIMKEEWSSRTKVAELELDTKAFAASFNEPAKYSDGVKYSSQQSWFMVILDFIRGLVRPVLTVYLCALMTYIYFHAEQMLHTDGMEALSVEKAVELVRYIIGTILYLTTSCVLWWFGTRNKQKQLGSK